MSSLDDLQGAQILADLFDAAGTGDHCGNMRIGRAPRDRELRQGDAELRSDDAKLAHTPIGVCIGDVILEPSVAGKRRSAPRRDAVLVLAGQESGGERAPGGQAETDPLVERSELLLHLVALEEVVLRLLHDRLVQVVTIGNLPRLEDVGRAPLRCAPVQGTTRRDDVVHRSDGLLDRRLGVGPVTEDQVEKVQAEAAQGPIDCVQQVLAVERVPCVDRVVNAPEELARDHIRVPRPAEFGDGFAHDGLGTPAGVDLGVVEEVDPRVVRGGKTIACTAAGELWTEAHPRTKREHAQPQP